MSTGMGSWTGDAAMLDPGNPWKIQNLGILAITITPLARLVLIL